MTIGDLILLNIINDKTRLIIRTNDFKVLTCGNWYQDNVLNYMNKQIDTFTWESDNKIFIDLPETVQ